MKLILLFIISYLSFVVYSIFLFNLSIEIIGIYLVLSIITFIVYALDKKAAKENKWRTKESTLHILSLLGGWPGALIAQNRLRHKSTKQPFKTILWITIVCNCSAFIYILSPDTYNTLIQDLLSMLA